MNVTYPTLESEIAKRGIKKTTMAKRIGISPRSFYNKLSGSVSFSWDEAIAITKMFFPDIDPTHLFYRTDKVQDKVQHDEVYREYHPK